MDPSSATSSPFKSGSLSSEGGKYLQRLRQLENENEIWKAKFEELYRWKSQVEAFLWEEFEFQSTNELSQTISILDTETPRKSQNFGTHNSETISSTPFATNLTTSLNNILKDTAKNSSFSRDKNQSKLDEVKTPAPNSANSSRVSSAKTKIVDDGQRPSTSNAIRNSSTVNSTQGQGADKRSASESKARNSKSLPSNKSYYESDSGTSNDTKILIPPTKKPKISAQLEKKSPSKIVAKKSLPSPYPTSTTTNRSGDRSNIWSSSDSDFSDDDERKSSSKKSTSLSSSTPSSSRKSEVTSTTPDKRTSLAVKKKNEAPKKEINEDARCSVCDDKYAEENNEMLFCDKCDICVHQACYGVKDIPPENEEWYCKPCALGLAEKPKCIFCPNTGGAMVPVRSPNNKSWSHVFCALWIPEVGFKTYELMDLVINVDKVHPRRWTMICSLCKKGKGNGACIQCFWKNCTTSFHVTCASINHLKMDGILDDNIKDGVALQAYCEKHRKVASEASA